MDNLTITLINPDSNERPLPCDQMAMVRLISLSCHPELLPEINRLMDRYGPMTVAAFLLYADGVRFDKASLREQLDDLLVCCFDTWEECRAYLTEQLHGWDRWIRRFIRRRKSPFDRVLRADGDTFRDVLDQMGFRCIETDEGYVLFRLRREDR